MSSDPPTVAARCRVKFHTMVSQAALTRFFAGSAGRFAEDGNSPDFSALVPASEPVAQPCRLQDTSHEKGVSRRQEALSRSLCNSGPSHSPPPSRNCLLQIPGRVSAIIDRLASSSNLSLRKPFRTLVQVLQ